MTETSTALLSVRADAELELPPDLATLWCWIEVFAASKSAALSTASTALDAVLTQLAVLGGGVRVAAAQRQPLAWTARSATTHVESELLPNKQRHVTGRIVANVHLTIEVRDFELLTRVGSALAAHDQLHIGRVEWWVDTDNAGWPQVRADAIHAAIAKARDYAAALGGSVEQIEHIADLGLLAGAGDGHVVRSRARALSGAGGMEETPSLDPVPQLLTAAIEARFTASVGALT